MGRRLASLAAHLGRPRDRRPVVHVLHVGKTGGTALNHTLVEHEAESAYRLKFGGHETTLAGVPEGELFLFLVRDPLTRFVSAFNSRLREGRPRYHYPWRESERVAFAHFGSPEALATSLSDPDPTRRRQAEEAMGAIGHLNTPYSFWFGDEDAFRARLSDLFFVGFQERLDEDFELLKRKLRLPASARLPRDPATAHQATPGADVELSAAGRANLERWYQADLAFVRLCRELAPHVNEPAGGEPLTA